MNGIENGKCLQCEIGYGINETGQCSQCLENEYSDGFTECKNNGDFGEYLFDTETEIYTLVVDENSQTDTSSKEQMISCWSMSPKDSTA